MPMSEARENGAMTDELGATRVAAIGDLHVRENQDLGPLRDLFAEMARTADVIVITGDVTDLGKPAEAELVATLLRTVHIPVVGVLGNHDYESGCVDEVKKILCEGGFKLLDGNSVEVGGVGFVGVKGFAGGFGARMLGSFGEPEIKTFVSESVAEAMRLELAMRGVRAKKAVVVLHYAPIQETVEGEPREIYPFLGSSRLAETIDRFDVSAIVHGHAHRGTYEGKTPRGAPVYNVASHIEKPTGRPYALLEI